MTHAYALSSKSTPRFSEVCVARHAGLRLLPAAPAVEPLSRHAPLASDAPAVPGRQVLLLALLAVAAHAAIVAGVWNRQSQRPTVRAPQEIELLRVLPQLAPEPPKPPPRRIEPPRVAEPPKSAPPPAARRTHAAQASEPDTMTVAENLTAPTSSGPVAAVATPPPAPAISAEEPVTEPNGYAGYLNNPAPAYPKAAQRLGIEGRVVLRVHVLANGQVGAAEIKRSSGKTILDDAALAAVKGWTFAPAKRGATPVDAWAQVPIDFKLAQ